MTDESFAHLPKTATIDVDALLRRLSGLDESTQVESVVISNSEAKIAGWQKEATAIRMVLAMIDGGVPEAEQSISAGEVVPFPHVRVAGPKLTHKYMALRVLGDSERGLRAADVIRQAIERFGKPIDKTSLSPLMAKLRESRLVAHDKERSEWSVTDAGRSHLAKMEAAAR